MKEKKEYLYKRISDVEKLANDYINYLIKDISKTNTTKGKITSIEQAYDKLKYWYRLIEIFESQIEIIEELEKEWN